MIVFNEAQTLGYSTTFNYLGDAFNYNNSSTLRIKGRMQSDKVFDGIPDTFFGIAYVDASGVWVPLDGFDGLSTGSTNPYSGYLSFDGGSAYVTLTDPGTGLLSELYFNSDYSPLYDIWEEMDRIKDRFQDFQEIYLNGISVGSGRVTKISFPESRDARVATYETEIELFKTGDLYNLTGQNYQNITIDPVFCKYVSSLGEDFNLTTDKDGVLSYKRSLNFDCVSPDLTESGLLVGVKAFASGIIFNDPAFQATLSSYPDFYEQEGSRYFTETYDNIQGSYSFSESFQGPTSGEKYHHSNSMSLSLESEGFSTVSEKGLIVGVRKNILTSAYEGMTEVENSSVSRANDFYNAYNDSSGVCVSGLFLKSKNKTINEEAGTIDYSFEYSNDPFSNNCFGVARDIQFSLSDGGIYTISERGSVRNFCQPTNSGKLNSAVTYFNDNISGDISGRIFEYYETQATGCGCSGTPTGSDLKKISSEFSYSDYEGLFNYSYVYRNDCTSLVDGCFNIISERNISDTIHNVFLGITPYSGELAQKQNTSSLISDQQSISVGSECTGKVIEDYLTVAINSLTIPTGSTYFMESAEYSFDPDNSKLSLNVLYNYTGYRPYTDYSV